MASEVDWSFDGRWPYAARFFDSADGRLAYVDEGGTDAEPVVLLHGNPTWGYLYRRVIPPLVAGGRRAIAVDHLGRDSNPLWTIRPITVFEINARWSR